MESLRALDRFVADRIETIGDLADSLLLRLRHRETWAILVTWATLFVSGVGGEVQTGAALGTAILTVAWRALMKARDLDED